MNRLANQKTINKYLVHFWKEFWSKFPFESVVLTENELNWVLFSIEVLTFFLWYLRKRCGINQLQENSKVSNALLVYLRAFFYCALPSEWGKIRIVKFLELFHEKIELLLHLHLCIHISNYCFYHNRVAVWWKCHWLNIKTTQYRIECGEGKPIKILWCWNILFVESFQWNFFARKSNKSSELVSLSRRIWRVSIFVCCTAKQIVQRWYIHFGKCVYFSLPAFFFVLQASVRVFVWQCMQNKTCVFRKIIIAAKHY